jgi:hypothetical protein
MGVQQRYDEPLGHTGVLRHADSIEEGTLQRIHANSYSGAHCPRM